MRSLMLAYILLLLAPSAGAKPIFPTSPLLEKKVKFWERVFGEFDSNQVAIHDRDKPYIVVDVIDVTTLGFESNLSPGARKAVEQAKTEYDEAISSFKTNGETVKGSSAVHRKIWRAYQAEAGGTKHLLSGAARLRSQGGLADTFLKASATAKVYLPKMEKIFIDHGLPPELTRLPFVESMFNIKARSKVGASGLWQIMPSAARPYLKVNSKVDQRNSPLLATQAAAKILRRNYAELGDWSLAITAYNHGLGGVKRAVSQTGSKKLHDIILDYESPSFGFASANFYAEFLAAVRVHHKITKKKLRPNVFADAQQP